MSYAYYQCDLKVSRTAGSFSNLETSNGRRSSRRSAAPQTCPVSGCVADLLAVAETTFPSVALDLMRVEHLKMEGWYYGWGRILCDGNEIASFVRGVNVKAGPVPVWLWMGGGLLLAGATEPRFTARYNGGLGWPRRRGLAFDECEVADGVQIYVI